MANVERLPLEDGVKKAEKTDAGGEGDLLSLRMVLLEG